MPGRVSSFPASHEGYETNDPAIRGVAWYLDPKYNGKGYGHEAAKKMIDYLFSECEIEEIKTEAAIQNLASWKIMEKLGFVRLDKTKMVEYTFIDKPVEAYQYYLTKEMFFENNKLNKIY